MKTSMKAASLLITVASLGCNKPTSSDLRGGKPAGALQIEWPASGVWSTSEPTVLIAGSCDRTVRSLTTSVGALADGDCADESFNLEPLTLVARTTDVTVAGVDAAGDPVTDTLVITWDDAPDGALITITAPIAAETVTKSPVLVIQGACRSDVTSITSSRAANVAVDCAASRKFRAEANVAADGTYDWRLTATTTDGGEASAARRFVVDRAQPQLAITEPATEYFGPGKDLVVRGTCDAGVTSLTADVPLADADCADGSWRTAPFQLTWAKRSVEVTGVDRAGNEVKATQRLTKTVLLGRSDFGGPELILGENTFIWTDGTRMAMTDRTNNRVLLFDTWPSGPTAVPDVVLGQPDLLTVSANTGGVSAQSLNDPRGPYYDGSKFYVPDTGNGRVLIWNGWPTTNRQPADVVVGSTRKDAVIPSAIRPMSAATFDQPVVVREHAGALWVVDLGNRVLKFGSVPTSDGAAADLVLGQPDFSTKIANYGGISASSLNLPGGIAFVGGKLAIADRQNQRILVWNSLPNTNGKTADVVLGQADFESAEVAHTSARSLRYPESLTTDGTRLVVSDRDANRVLVWHTVPTAHHAPADVVLGQSKTVSSAPNGGGVSASSLSCPCGPFFVGTRLWVKDNGNDRLVGFDATALATGMSADVVWGVPNFATTRTLSKTMTPLSAPESTFYHDGKYYVADTGNNRVLIYDEFPGMPNAVPAVVLGQPDLFQTAANNPHDPLNETALNPLATSARGLSAPSSVMTDGTRLYVADTGNNRVLIWNTIPTESFVPAAVVVGQPNMASNTADNPGLGSQSMSLDAPRAAFAVTGDGTPETTKLLVADTNNHRVLVWDGLPAANGAAASFIMGQTSLTTTTAGNADAGMMRSPNAVWSNGTKVAVADTGNHRVLLFDSFPDDDDGIVATTVIGQLDGTTRTVNQNGRSATSLSSPAGVVSNGSNLVVADTDNHRVLIYNSWPSGILPAANVVLGQQTFDTSVVSNNGALEGTAISSPRGLAMDGSGLLVSSTGTDLVLHYRNMPTVNGMRADASVSGGFEALRINGQLFSRADRVLRVGNKLFVADAVKNAVYGWNSIPDEHNVGPDFVLGQADTVDYLPNAGGPPSRTSLWAPSDMASDGTRFAVADTSNHRVLLYDSVPSSAAALPDRVLGQPDFVTRTPNAAGVTSSGLKAPRAVVIVGGKLVVSDPGNNRVLIWNSWPTANNAPADVVLGQPDMTTNVARNGGVSARSLTVVSAIASDGNNLVVADNFNNRVLIWNEFPTTNFAPADVILGQPDPFTTDNFGVVGATARSLNDPRGLGIADGKLVVSSLSQSNRILIWDEMPTETYQAADRVWGQIDLNATDVIFAPGRCGRGWSHFNDAELMMVSCWGRSGVMIVPTP